MKIYLIMKRLYLLEIFLYGTFCTVMAQPAPQHDLLFTSLANTWDEGIPLGNGMVGALIWQKDNNLRISLDRADLWDMRPMKGLDRPEFTYEWTANGVSGGIKNSAEKTVSGETSAIFSARSSGVSPREGSWIHMEKNFEPWLNLEKNQALGVWIKGDGNGELLNFRVEGPLHLSHGTRGDHFVKIDFTGWRYFELVEIESAEFSNYVWPNAGNIYNSYLFSVQFNNVDKLQLWYNNLPAGKEVSCLVGPIKAIPTVAGTIENPSITIGGEKIVFPVRMESGMYLEFLSFSDCKLYGSKGELLKEVTPIGENPNLVNGRNEISFSCDGPEAVNARMQVSVIGEGKPLKKQ